MDYHSWFDTHGALAMTARKAKWGRYTIRDDGTGWMAVYDIFTGRTVELDGIPMDGLDVEAAVDIALMLNVAENERLAGKTH